MPVPVPVPVPVRSRSRLSEFAASIDLAFQRIAHAGVTWVLWPIAYAATLGSAAWAAHDLGSVVTLDTNKLPLEDTLKMLLWGGGALAVVFLIYVFSVLIGCIRTGEWRTLETITRLNGRLRPLLALPFVPALTQAAIERDSPKQTFFYIAIAAALCGAGVYAWAHAPSTEIADASSDDPPRTSAARTGLARAVAAIGVFALWAGYGIFFSRLAIINHRALNTRTTDLGYYDNIFYQSIHGKPLACSFIKAGYHGSAHFDPLLVLLSPLYLLYPHADLLLVLQSVWLGAGVVPMYLLAKEKLGRRAPAVALAAMYAIYPAMQGANMYEFHSLTLLAPIFLFLLYFLEKGSRRGYYPTLVIALLCREDVALLMCFVGLYALLEHRKRLPRVGWITIVASIAYFGIVKKFFMTSSDIFMSGKDSYSFAYYYEDLIPNHNGMGGLLISLVTNPVFVLKTMFAEAKLVYLMTLFLPLAFLPFVAKPGRVMLAYGLLFCLLASRSAVYSPAFQYSTVIFPVAFALTPIALRRIEDARLVPELGLDGGRLARGLLGAAFVASLLVAWKFGGIVDNTAFHGGFSHVARGLTDADKETYAWIRETAAKIPRSASVGTTNRMGAHVSNRQEAYFYPEHGPTDYVFLDEGELHGGDLDRHTKNVQQGLLVQVARRKQMALFKKGGSGGATAPAVAPVPLHDPDFPENDPVAPR